MDKETIETILDNIEIGFQTRKIQIFHGKHYNRFWVQVGMMRPDTYEPERIELGKGNKAYISQDATEDEIVKKVLELAIAYVEHEIREGFTYHGMRLFNPHLDIRSLMSISSDTVGTQQPV